MHVYGRNYVWINDTSKTFDNPPSSSFPYAFHPAFPIVIIVDYVIRIIDRGLKTHYSRGRFGRDITTDIIINDTSEINFAADIVRG